MLAFLQQNWMLVLLAIAALDKVLAQIPSIKANSTFQLLTSIVDGAVAGSTTAPAAQEAPAKAA